jgi:hypothetical protein
MVAVPAGACALLAVLLWLVGRMREGVTVREGEAPQPALALGATAWRSLGMLRGSRLLQATAAATALMVLLRLALRWLYGTSFEQSCSSTDALTRFLGGYTMVASVFGVMLQVVATPHLLRKLGVARLNVAYGLALLGAFGWLAAAPSAMGGAAGRFTDTALKAAIKTPLSAIFYDALGVHERADARAVVLGIVSPVTSVVGSAALIWIAARPGWTEAAAWACVGASVGYVLLSAGQGRAYQRALRERLIRWARERASGPEPTVQEAISEALQSGDGRMADIAREVRRHNRG